jgi:hypothetical protein
VEEAYRSAEGLCKLLGLEAGPVLRFEVPLLQGLQFDLVVHSPYRALAGLFKVWHERVGLFLILSNQFIRMAAVGGLVTDRCS